MTGRDFFEKFGRPKETRERPSCLDEAPWFALVTWRKDGYLDCVFLARSFHTYCEAWHQANEEGLSQEAWLGTLRDCEAFRARCYQRLTKK